MESLSRRRNIMRLLYRYRHMTVRALAEEFGVSERTIRRDIVELSLTEPIFTQTGRYDGGVYISEDYTADKIGMKRAEIAVFDKLIAFAENAKNCDLTSEELMTAKHFIADYIKAISNF